MPSAAECWHLVSSIRHQDGNRPILTFCDILDHHHAVVQCALSEKLSAYGEKGSTGTGVTADHVDTILAGARRDRRQDAAH
jgi:hypothetical protein